MLLLRARSSFACISIGLISIKPSTTCLDRLLGFSRSLTNLPPNGSARLVESTRKAVDVAVEAVAVAAMEAVEAAEEAAVDAVDLVVVLP